MDNMDDRMIILTRIANKSAETLKLKDEKVTALKLGDYIMSEPGRRYAQGELGEPLNTADFFALGLLCRGISDRESTPRVVEMMPMSMEEGTAPLSGFGMSGKPS